jgi:hypothetical protein
MEVSTDAGGGVGAGGGSGTGGKVGGSDAAGGAPDVPLTDGASLRTDAATSGTGGAGVTGIDGATAAGTGGSTVPGTGGGGAAGGAGGMGGAGGGDVPAATASGGGGGATATGGAGDSGGAKDAAAGGAGGGDAPVAGDAAGAGGGTDAAGGAGGTGGTTADPCNPPPPSGYHAIHFRYLWAGQKTLTLFPKPELMPKTIEMDVTIGTGTSAVTCNREQDRPWFNCPVPDGYFATGAAWRVLDKSHNPSWNTVAPRPLPTTAKEYWLRWSYGRPDIPRSQDPPNFEFLDYYPDAAYGDWSAMGQWNDATCVPKPPASPLTVGFGGSGWFPYQSTEHKYSYGASLAYVYPDRGKAQDALDAFAFERYNLWKKNWIKYDAEACGDGTARVHTDPPETVSEGQGYGIAVSAAVGDKELFGKLWNFVRHYRSQAKYCGLLGWMWRGTSDCQALDAFATDAGSRDSAFDGDVDTGIGLVYAALQWPEYTDAATDWLVRMECEVNTKYGDGWNYPTEGDTWDKDCASGADKCDYASGTASQVMNDFFPPGYFRVFGDFLAAKLGAGATAANGQTHRDFWYKTAETVYELLERCYDQSGVHPGLVGNGGDILHPCSNIGGGQPYEWGRALWRVGIDAAWFGNNTGLPENSAGSSSHYSGKSRMQAKLDNAQGFYAGFYRNNPPEPNANRFSTLCDQLTPAGTVTNCDPAYGHNTYTVNMAMCTFASLFDNGGATTASIRREALEESLSTTLQSEHYFEESLGIYSILFLTGNFPNPMTVPGQ